jgi:hypothetical protein
MSLRERLDDAQAKRMPDKIVVIGEFLQDAGNETFTRSEVEQQFQAAGEGKPGNFGRDFQWAIRNGWLSPEVGSTKNFYVTKTGRTAIEKQFGADVKKATAQPKAGRRRKKATQRETTAQS